MAAGMFAVAVTWGRIHDRARLEREEPDAIADSAEELLELL
jgi:phosphoglycolate phosphatase-like HAD superfamily hydrolase